MVKLVGKDSKQILQYKTLSIFLYSLWINTYTEKETTDTC